LVSKVKEAHLLFTEEQKNLVNRQNNARTLFLVGGILTFLGAGIAITGGLFLHDLGTKNPYTDYNCEAQQEPAVKRLCEEQRALPNPIIAPPRDNAGQASLKQFYGWGGPTFLASGLVVGGTGIALLIAGLVTLPPKDAQINAVLRSQEKFLKEHGSPSEGSSWQRPPPNLSSPHRAALLGIFR
jgi:hypothetical protein